MVSSPAPASGPRSVSGASGRSAAAAASNRWTPRSVPLTVNRDFEKSRSVSAASSSHAAMRRPLSTIWSDALAMTTPARRIERPECDPPPTEATSVSPVIRRTCRTSTSNHSAMSWAKLVSWPWPAESVPMTTSIRPSGRTVISARSRGMPVFSSM